MELIDSHCHLDFEVFDSDRDRVIANARTNGVQQFVVPGVSAARWPSLITLCQQHNGLNFALGLHPCFTHQHQAADLPELETLCRQHRPVAIGEIGLDFFQPEDNRALQIPLFEQQLQLAQSLGLPVIIHARKSIDEVIRLLRKTGFSYGGIMHAFNGSLQQAKPLTGLGFLFGFGGMLTYDRSSKLRKLASQLPLESIVLETDSPDMSGATHQGQRNSPEYLPEVLTALSTIRKMDALEIAMQTTQNVKSVLSLPTQAHQGKAG